MNRPLPSADGHTAQPPAAMPDASTLNAAPSGERTHLTLYGRRNAGKSSLINALTGQEVALVSPVKGTTTDPVGKAMELLPLGPVVFTDTPGLDDEGTLGAERVRRANLSLMRTDLLLLVTTAEWGVGDVEKSLLARAAEQKIPVVVIFNQCDRAVPTIEQKATAATFGPVYEVSAATGAGLQSLKEGLARQMPDEMAHRRLLGDLLRRGEVVVLVTPIDSAAPKGRLILPQQQAIRDALDAGAQCIVVQEDALADALNNLRAPPALVVTDSQAFRRVAATVPAEVPLTSFSILFARYKGDLSILTEGAKHVEKLKDGDRILMAEGCTHHRQEDDIGTVKIPRWLLQKTGKALTFGHCSGLAWPADLSSYALAVHCGGCMLTRREMLARIEGARVAGVPIVNYGVLIAHLNGILPRALAALKLANR